MSVPNDDAAASASLAESISNINLTDGEEDELLRGDDGEEGGGREEGEIMEPESAPPYVALSPERAMLMDVQLVYHRGRGSLIKELAYRMLNSHIVSGLNMIHEADDVPAHLVVPAEDGSGGHYDVHTGLKLEDGECLYDDKRVACILAGASVVFVKGANKKKALLNLCDRQNDSGAGAGGSDGTPHFQRPIIINMDGHTADEEDRQFCKNNRIRLAAFSFPFVYANMHVYEKMLYYRADDAAGAAPHLPGDFLYVSNVLSKDPRYELSGKGRIVCVCYSDHSRGGAVTAFDKKQRCSLLNLSILDHLWVRQQDGLFRELVRNDPLCKSRGAEEHSVTRENHQHQHHRITSRRGRRGRRHRRGGGEGSGDYPADQYFTEATVGGDDDEQWQRYCREYDYDRSQRAEDEWRRGEYYNYDRGDGYYDERRGGGYPRDEDDRRGFHGQRNVTRRVYDSEFEYGGQRGCYPVREEDLIDRYAKYYNIDRYYEPYARGYGRKRRSGGGSGGGGDEEEVHRMKTPYDKRHKTQRGGVVFAPDSYYC